MSTALQSKLTTTRETENGQIYAKNCQLSTVNLAQHRAVGPEQGQLFEVDEILPLLGVALGENRHAPADFAAGLFHQRFQSVQALTGGNHIIHDENPLALHEGRVRAV